MIFPIHPLVSLKMLSSVAVMFILTSFSSSWWEVGDAGGGKNVGSLKSKTGA